jgi:hypothetical protein
VIGGEDVGRAALRRPHPVADTIEQRFPQVRLERAPMPWLEGSQSLNDVRERVLHEIVCIERASRPGGQPAPGKFLEARKVTGAEIVQGLFVTRLRASDQVHRCQRIHGSGHGWCPFTDYNDTLRSPGQRICDVRHTGRVMHVTDEHRGDA